MDDRGYTQFLADSSSAHAPTTPKGWAMLAWDGSNAQKPLYVNLVKMAARQATFGFTPQSLTNNDTAATKSKHQAALSTFLMRTLTPEAQAAHLEYSDPDDEECGFKLWNKLSHGANNKDATSVRRNVTIINFMLVLRGSQTIFAFAVALASCITACLHRRQGPRLRQGR